MKIPTIEYQQAAHQPMPENLFNPIIHESPESVIEKKNTECMCDSTDPDDFYPNNKRRCRYCVNQHVLKLRKGIIKPSRNRKA